MDQTSCSHCSAVIIPSTEGACPECGKPAVKVEAAPDQPRKAAPEAVSSTDSEATSWGSVLLALVAGLVAAKLTGFVIYLLTSAVSLDPMGAGLIAGQVLFYFVRAVGGYVSGRVLGRRELVLSAGLAALDIGSMMGLWLVVRFLGIGTEEMRQAIAAIKPIEYGYELAVALPGYLIGGGLALIQRRYLRTRTAGPRAVGLGCACSFSFPEGSSRSRGL